VEDSSSEARGRETRSRDAGAASPERLPAKARGPFHLDGPGGQMPLVSTGTFERNVAPVTPRKESSR
jgi:hypothetical protein